MFERKQYFKAVNVYFVLLCHSWCSMETHILRYRMVFATMCAFVL